MSDVISILANIAVIAASLVALYSVNSWRHEHIGRRNIDLAEEVLEAFYKARDSVRRIRSPFSYRSEGSTRTRSPNETPAEAEIYDRAYILIERYREDEEIFQRLHSLRYRFEVRFGRDAIQPFLDLHRVIQDLISSSRQLSRLWRQQGREFRTEDEQRRHLDQMHAQEDIFWEVNENDDINTRVRNLVSSVEEICSPIIRHENKTFFDAIKVRWFRTKKN